MYRNHHWIRKSLCCKLLEAETMFKGYTTICLLYIRPPLLITVEDRLMDYTYL